MVHPFQNVKCHVTLLLSKLSGRRRSHEWSVLLPPWDTRSIECLNLAGRVEGVGPTKKYLLQREQKIVFDGYELLQ